jgi:hypothetical protein
MSAVPTKDSRVAAQPTPPPKAWARALPFFAAGYLVLLAAVAANLLAQGLGLFDWYDLVRSLSNDPLAVAFAKPSLLDWLWLLLVYPGILGWTALTAARRLGC